MLLKFRSGQITFAFQFCLLSWLRLHEELSCSHRRGFTPGMSSQEHSSARGLNRKTQLCEAASLHLQRDRVQRVQTDLQISYAFPNHNSKYPDNYP